MAGEVRKDQSQSRIILPADAQGSAAGKLELIENSPSRVRELRTAIRVRLEREGGQVKGFPERFADYLTGDTPDRRERAVLRGILMSEAIRLRELSSSGTPIRGTLNELILESADLVAERMHEPDFQTRRQFTTGMALSALSTVVDPTGTVSGLLGEMPEQEMPQHTSSVPGYYKMFGLEDLVTPDGRYTYEWGVRRENERRQEGYSETQIRPLHFDTVWWAARVELQAVVGDEIQRGHPRDEALEWDLRLVIGSKHWSPLSVLEKHAGGDDKVDLELIRLQARPENLNRHPPIFTAEGLKRARSMLRRIASMPAASKELTESVREAAQREREDAHKSGKEEVEARRDYHVGDSSFNGLEPDVKSGQHRDWFEGKKKGKMEGLADRYPPF
ncbi:MAG: hypothetical protein GF416_07465 [Candidatus Altiarchaeales archaeon]|nr:hypothetical protein [Candidatus Altiarchaeales archaeon]MBD3416950.1 hypothetical protein [Candidatus Altiarchaeales archaeon]